MDRNRIQLCADMGNGLDIVSMASLLADGVFGDTNFASLLKARYQQMQTLFRDVPYNDPRWNLDGCHNKVDHGKRDARLIVPRYRINSNEQNQNVMELFDHDNFGHDMPVWLSYNDDKTAKRVMIISQDPLRVDDEKGNLYLSTPFGVHSRDFENGGRQKMDPRVRDMVTKFLERGYCVYLTDLMKFFAEEQGFIGNLIGKDDSQGYRSIFSKTLAMEIKKVKPTLFIVLGSEALRNGFVESPLGKAKWQKAVGIEVQQLGCGYNVIWAYHPSHPNMSRIKEFVGPQNPVIKYYEQVSTTAVNFLTSQL